MRPEDMILVSVDDHLVEDRERVRRRGDDVEIRSFDHGRFERTVGAALGSVGAKLDV